MLHLLLGLHDHQPVGNFDFVLERAYRVAYRPFLDVWREHPEIRLSLHHTGILYKWLERAHPDYMAELASQVRDGNLEIIGGAFYEPILSLLPEKDARGQIQMMRAYVRENFGKDPKGFWLAERVWEPQLPKTLAACGVKYVLVDDFHFRAAGFSPEQLRGYFLTESEGKSVAVFPIDQRMRYLMPFEEPEAVVGYLKKVHAEAKGRDACVVMGDDGEKFGMWPLTFDKVYGERWLHRLFELLAREKDWLITNTFSNYMASHGPLGSAYLPTGSYFELSEWALPPQPAKALDEIRHATTGRALDFLRGGYFRNFLTKYAESTRLYRKMLRTSKKVQNAKRGADGASAKVQSAQDLLYQGQCNCSYWHGVFGGLYLPHLRTAIYKCLIAADRLAEPGAAGADWEDWDSDGKDELFVESPGATWGFAPGKGAGMFEWSLKGPDVNYANGIRRRPEAYHDKLADAVVVADPKKYMAEIGSKSIHDILMAKEPDLEKYLHYDRLDRMLLLDRFLSADATPDAVFRDDFEELGDFAGAEYEVEGPVRVPSGWEVFFARDGAVRTPAGPVPVRIEKTVRLLDAGGWSADYRVVNNGAGAARLRLATEVPIAFSHSGIVPGFSEERFEKRTFRDEPFGLEVELSTDGAAGLWSVPFYTVSLSEEGFEKTYQQNMFFIPRVLELPAGGEARFRVAAAARVLRRDAVEAA